jgi:hypothetical protein
MAILLRQTGDFGPSQNKEVVRTLFTPDSGDVHSAAMDNPTGRSSFVRIGFFGA